MTSDDVRIMEHVVDDMTTEVHPMSTVFAAPPPPPTAPPPTAAAAPPPTAPPPTAPAAPPPAAPPPTAPPPTAPPPTAPAAPPAAPAAPPAAPPPAAPPAAPPTTHRTLNCRSAFREEIYNYIEFLRPRWDEHFTDGMMQLLLFTAYRYAKHSAKEKSVQWKKTRYDISEMFNVTSLCSVEHARHFTEHSMKIILMHAALTACHTKEAPPLSRGTMEMVKKVAKFDYTVDCVGLAMMCDEVDQISTTNFLQFRHSAMLASGEDDNDISFPFTFELNKYVFNTRY